MLNRFGIILLLLFFPAQAFAGTMVLDYGFEDWTGATGAASPAPGYIFSTSSYLNDCSSSDFWGGHRDGTEGTTGGASCGGNTAYEGSYYWHLNWYSGEEDACLGTTPCGVSTASNIGANATYPTGDKNTLTLTSAITTATITARFYFRTTGNWTSTQADLDTGYGLKFFRLYGGDGAGDDSSVLIKCLNDGDDVSPNFEIYRPDTLAHVAYDPGINWQDGNWHSISIVAVRNNDTNSANNMTLSFWIDDWDMTGAATGSLTYTISDLGSAYVFINMFGNWSAAYPTSAIGIDMDKYEIWDGLPDASPVATASNIVSSGVTFGVAP